MSDYPSLLCPPLSGLALTQGRSGVSSSSPIQRIGFSFLPSSWLTTFWDHLGYNKRTQTEPQSGSFCFCSLLPWHQKYCPEPKPRAVDPAPVSTLPWWPNPQRSWNIASYDSLVACSFPGQISLDSNWMAGLQLTFNYLLHQNLPGCSCREGKV